jgi:hypothetical protein
MIEEERLHLIPEEYRQQHSFCFWLHDLILDVMKQALSARIADVHFEFKSEDEKKAFAAASDPITFCLENGRSNVAKRIVLNQLVLPLYADALHFIFESLKALEKRKYTIAFALLRKPFKYSLLFLTWIFADEDDFYARLASDPGESFNEQKISKEKRKTLLADAIAGLHFNSCFDCETIYGMVFDRNNPSGLTQLFDKANHLVTSHPSMRTENLNLNFIFKNPLDTDLYDGTYFLIGYILLYLLFLEIEMLARMTIIPEYYRGWIETSTLVTFESVFETTTNALDAFNSAWQEMMTCLVCQKAYRVTPESALEFFAHERIRCGECGADQPLPMFWLMSKVGSHGLPPDEASEDKTASKPLD